MAEKEKQNGETNARARYPGKGSPGADPSSYSMDRLSHAFETSARRWELIVYPSLFAFIILAAYGFYLIFSLAKDVQYFAISVDSNMTVLASNMQSVSDSVGQMTANVRTMAVSVESMARDVSTLEPMLVNLDAMNESIRHITFTTHNMRGDMALMRGDMSGMNQSMGRPMSFFNSFMPW